MDALRKICLTAGLLVALSPLAQANDAHHAHGGAASAATVELADGEIRKVNKEAGKLTIKHGELKSLGMPPMTMVFRVQDAAMLESVKVGDRVSFAAENLNGALTVTRLEPVK